VTNRPSLDVRRWIALLCIALVAVFSLDLAEAAAPCANTDCSAACDLGTCDDQDEHGRPCAQHHCCHGVNAVPPTPVGALLRNQLAERACAGHDALVASLTLDTLERPPKAIHAG
jgi:hypothetical protein